MDNSNPYREVYLDLQKIAQESQETITSELNVNSSQNQTAYSYNLSQPNTSFSQPVNTYQVPQSHVFPGNYVNHMLPTHFNDETQFMGQQTYESQFESTNRHLCTGNIDQSLFQNKPIPKPRTSNKKFCEIQECEYILPNIQKGFRTNANLYSLICIPFNIQSPDGPQPYPPPNRPKDFWNNFHVKMPNSPLNQRFVNNSRLGINSQGSISTWNIINKCLTRKINSFLDLNDVIKKYNNYHNFDFDVLRSFLEPQPQMADIYEILNYMAKLALMLPKLITKSVPLLRQKINSSLFLSQKQIACLLANAFFCTFPRRSRKNDEYKNYPCINFVKLFSSFGKSNEIALKTEKLKCIFNYFQRFQQISSNGIISFERQYLSSNEMPDWPNSNKLFKGFKVEISGSIEENGRQYSEVEFANKFIGGGVLNNGAFQEEIRFLISPELIVSRLFIESLIDEESLIINGTIRFNQHKGYGESFKWTGYIGDDISKDVWGRYCTQVIAIDATDFQLDQQKQFDIKQIDRQLNKAFCGFKDNSFRNDEKPAIASGKWGCGGYSGDPFLNCLIQFMAASQTDRDLILFTMNDTKLSEKLSKLYELIKIRNWSVGTVYKVLQDFSTKDHLIRKTTNIIDFICANCK